MMRLELKVWHKSGSGNKGWCILLILEKREPNYQMQELPEWFGLWNAREDSKSVHTRIQVIAESRVAKSVLGKQGGDREGLLVHRKKHVP